jgi:hypothetical protein
MAAARVLIGIAVLFFCGPAGAASEKRVALVIGNNAYVNLTKLGNPAPDARQVAASLRAHGYQVLDRYDVSRADFLDALDSFRDSYLPGAAEAFVYYAGHGIAVEGRDILVPVDLGYDCDANTGQMKVSRAVPWDEVERQLREVPKLVIVLDACRSNAFERCKSRGVGEGGGFRGLTRTAHSGGVLIVNSTALGNEAQDGAPGKNSPFAGVLLKRMQSQPGAYYHELFFDVSGEVSELTQGRQVPEVLVRGAAPEACLSGACGTNTVIAEAPPKPQEEKPKPPQPAQIAAAKPEQQPALSAPVPKPAVQFQEAAERPLRTLAGHRESVRSIALTSDGRYALSADYSNLKLWELATGKELRSFSPHAALVRTTAFTPDGRYALMGTSDRPVLGEDNSQRIDGGNSLRFWNLSKGREVRAIQGIPFDSTDAVAITPDARFGLSKGWTRELKFWDLSAGRELRTLKGHTGQIYSVAISRDGRYGLSGASDGDNTLKFWDLSTGQARHTLSGHTGRVYAVAMTPDGRYGLSGGQDKTLKFWDLSTGLQLRTFIGHTEEVVAVALTSDGRYALSGSCAVHDKANSKCTKGSMKLWDTAKGQEVHEFSGGNWIGPVAITPEGRLALSSEGNELKLWDLSEWTQPREARQ